MFGTDGSTDAPRPEQIEITVIGPGFGESLCVHPGGGRWWVVDSCIARPANTAAPLSYLRSLGVDTGQQVDLIVATHWHDDHSGGLSQLLGECPAAQFCLSAALTNEEFYRLVARYESAQTSISGSRLKELSRVFQILQDTHRIGRRATQGRVLHRLGAAWSGHGFECVITSLSPSDFSEQVFIDQILAHMAKSGEPKRPMPSLAPNDASVALWIEIGHHRVLLGADLEDSADERRGWKAYLASDNCPIGRASFIKIPHHGSRNAHNADLWDNRLESNPVAVVTPWRRGARALPSSSDLARISNLSSAAFITSRPRRPRAASRPNMVLRQIKESGISIRTLPVGEGAVRCRAEGARTSAVWCIETLESGARVSAP